MDSQQIFRPEAIARHANPIEHNILPSYQLPWLIRCLWLGCMLTMILAARVLMIEVPLCIPRVQVLETASPSVAPVTADAPALLLLPTASQIIGLGPDAILQLRLTRGDQLIERPIKLLGVNDKLASPMLGIPVARPDQQLVWVDLGPEPVEGPVKTLEGELCGVPQSAGTVFLRLMQGAQHYGAR